MKLVKISKDYYKTIDGRYELKKDCVWRNKRLIREWKLYDHGHYIAMPESIKMANEMIKIRG